MNAFGVHFSSMTVSFDRISENCIGSNLGQKSKMVLVDHKGHVTPHGAQVCPLRAEAATFKQLFLTATDQQFGILDPCVVDNQRSSTKGSRVQTRRYTKHDRTRKQLFIAILYMARRFLPLEPKSISCLRTAGKQEVASPSKESLTSLQPFL